LIKKLFILLYRFWKKLSFSCRENLEVDYGQAKNRLCLFGTARFGVPDFRLAGQKVGWLWENPWKIVAENSPFIVLSCNYEKVRTFFYEKCH